MFSRWQFSMFHWILWERVVRPGRCHCSTQVSSEGVLERHERYSGFASGGRGHKAFSTVVTKKMVISGSVYGWSLANWAVSVGSGNAQVNSFQSSLPRRSKSECWRIFLNRSTNRMIQLSILGDDLRIFLLTLGSRMALEKICCYI